MPTLTCKHPFVSSLTYSMGARERHELPKAEALVCKSRLELGSTGVLIRQAALRIWGRSIWPPNAQLHGTEGQRSNVTKQTLRAGSHEQPVCTQICCGEPFHTQGLALRTKEPIHEDAGEACGFPARSQQLLFARARVSYTV